MSRIRDTIRLHRIKLKLAARQGSIGFIPIGPDHGHEPGLVIVPCWYCHYWFLIKDMTIEHIVNRREGGTNKQENLVLACRHCNAKRNKVEQGRAARVHRLRKKYPNYIPPRGMA